MNSLFDSESYNLEHLVEDCKRWARKNNPPNPKETKDDYNDRIFWIANDEMSRRILVSGIKRPDYSTENVHFKQKKSIKIKDL